MSTRVVACCDESNRHHDKSRVRFDFIFKKFHRLQEKRPGNDSNGFGKLIGRSFLEKYETIGRGSFLGSNRHFATRLPNKNDEIMGFWQISIIFFKKMAGFKTSRKWRHVIHDHHEASLRRSKTFRSASGEFGVNVPFKTPPLKWPT